MKKFILLVVIAALSSMHLCGQTRPPAGMPYMEFTVARQTTFKFKLQGHFKNTDVWVSTSVGNYTHQTISDVWADYQTVSAGRLPTTVKIYGAIKAIDAGLKTTNEDNKLSLIDVTKNSSLKALFCYGAGIRTLNISENSELTILECSNNLLKNLDVSQNNKLEGFNCANNQLLLLNVANGSNNKLSSFDASGNPSLTCIQVDDGFIPSDTWKKDAAAEWNNDSANPCPNNYQISFTTTKAVGETIKLGIKAASADQSTIWIDLNNNGIKDDGEAVTSAGTMSLTEYTLGAQNITLYGKVSAFDCGSNQLSSLDVCKNEHLINLRCNNNSLNSLDVSKNINLTILCCYSNQLSNLDISQNTNLTDLLCNSNQLSNLDISENIKLKILNCATNLIANLDFSQNPDLTRLTCNSNQLKSLILDQKTKLISLSCQNNQLTSLNVANGNNANVTTFNATNNPNLTCIQVDDGFIPSDTWKKDATAEWNNDSANPCSDPNSYQISFTTTKAVGETIKLGVTAESADQSTIWIDLNNNGIKDVGEAVTSAPILALTEYVLGAQSITLYGKVTAFNCGSNKINSLDISQNSHLTMLRCNNNSLNSLDVSKNINLTSLYSSSNQLSNLDVGQNTNLTDLLCNSNQLSTLDISENIKLKTLNCAENLIANLDFSQNPDLTRLSCNSNQLKSLILDQKTKLISLSCQDNQLTSLNVANGNNVNVTNFNATGNPNLTCIQVDDGFIPSDTWKKDAAAEWNNDSANPCPNNFQISFTTTKEVGETISLKIDAAIDDQANVWIDLNNNGSKDDGEAITAFSQTSSTEYTLGANKVTLYGKINFFIGSDNALSSLDVSRNTLLTYLNCDNNTLSNLDVSKNSKLTMLICRSNTLTSLDVTNITNLKSLYFSNNQLTSIDVSQNKVLSELLCDNNQLTSLDVSQNTELYRFRCFSNQLTSLDISQNKVLSELLCDNNQLTSLDVSQNTELYRFRCFSNQLTSLDISQNKVLSELLCDNNQLTSLDISQNTALNNLYCYSNQLKTLDVSKNEHLINLRCNNNSLNSLDVSKNINLTSLYCYSNQLSTLDISENIKLETLNCAENLIANLDFSQNPDLTRLYCNSNQLKSLILDQNTKLISLNCKDNQLTNLNVANGNNDNVTTFNATGNPNLTCIQVDDGFIPSDTWKKDAAAEWNNDSANPCVTIVVGINDLILNRVKIYPNPAKETLYILSDVEVLEVELFNIEGRLILKQNHSDAISIGHLPGGIYQVVIFTDNGVYTEKMIKQ